MKSLVSQRVNQIPSRIRLCKYSQRIRTRFNCLVPDKVQFNCDCRSSQCMYVRCVYMCTGTRAYAPICKIKMQKKKISQSFNLSGSYRQKQLRADDFMECLHILRTFLKGYFHTFKTSSKLEHVFIFAKIQSSPFGHDIYSRQ